MQIGGDLGAQARHGHFARHGLGFLLIHRGGHFAHHAFGGKEIVAIEARYARQHQLPAPGAPDDRQGQALRPRKVRDQPLHRRGRHGHHAILIIEDQRAATRSIEHHTTRRQRQIQSGQFRPLAHLAASADDRAALTLRHPCNGAPCGAIGPHRIIQHPGQRVLRHIGPYITGHGQILSVEGEPAQHQREQRQRAEAADEFGRVEMKLAPFDQQPRQQETGRQPHRDQQDAPPVPPRGRIEHQKGEEGHEGAEEIQRHRLGQIEADKEGGDIDREGRPRQPEIIPPALRRHRQHHQRKDQIGAKQPHRFGPALRMMMRRHPEPHRKQGRHQTAHHGQNQTRTRSGQTRFLS